jgi:hypothetical protein
MPNILPSQIAQAIDSFFGASRNEIYSQHITAVHRVEVHALLSLLDEIPRELIDLPFPDYSEFLRCRAVLATALARWNVGDDLHKVRDVGGKDPIVRIQRLMSQCQDQLPPPEPEMPFIQDLDARKGIEEQIHAAWTDFNAREWMGATVFAGVALEALLLWALKRCNGVPPDDALRSTRKKSLDDLHLPELIDEATKANIINADSASLARFAKDARNLIHPGRVARSGSSCSKATLSPPLPLYTGPLRS